MMGKSRKVYSSLFTLVALAAFALFGTRVVFAGGATTNAVSVSDQEIGPGNTVTVDSITADVAGWIVIHADNNGAPGPIIGVAPVDAGTTTGQRVAIDLRRATETLYAMLHVDGGTPGLFEFPGPDGPARDANGNIVTPSFELSASAVVVFDQPVSPSNTVTVARVLAKQQGWVVVHAQGADGGVGPVLGHAAVGPGENYNVNVVVDPAGVTDVMYAMLHTDAGEAFVYEFPGPDGPARDVDGNVVAPSFRRVTDAVTVYDQPLGRDATVTVQMILAEAPGWIVIHAEAENGGVGPIIGWAPVSAGYNYNVQVAVDTDRLKPTLYAMLHTDAGTAGTFEFPGPDGPVRDLDGDIITPSFSLLD
ncbi:MAG TPA: hypothetical protein ENI95_08940 [Chloroflexi bacterium]|nr:hypothetical protein [Chloroflexota bacterium]